MVRIMLTLPVLGPLTGHVLVLSRRVLDAISKADAFLDPVQQLLLRLELFLIREVDACAALREAKQERLSKTVILTMIQERRLHPIAR
jgi:hypothetical protein